MISVVIPVFNEQAVLPELHARLSRAAASWQEDYEVIVVDDGSSDGTPAQLEAIHRQDARWKVLTFSRNFGHQAAISAGLHYSAGDAVAIMDADLQDPPEELRGMIAKLREGYEVVYAIRTKRKENAMKVAGYRAFYRLLNALASIDIPPNAGDFCVLDRRVVEVLKAMPERTRFLRGLRSWSGFRQIGMPYERAERAAGKPQYTYATLVRLAVNGILSFSSAPLRLASWTGFALCCLAILLTMVVIAWALLDAPLWGMRPRDAAGWTSIVSLLLLLSGVQLIILGIIGEYLARVFDEVHARPPWIISKALGISADKQRGAVGWFVEESPLTADRPEP